MTSNCCCWNQPARAARRNCKGRDGGDMARAAYQTRGLGAPAVQITLNQTQTFETPIELMDSSRVTERREHYRLWHRRR
jgi:hypothetical protein